MSTPIVFPSRFAVGEDLRLVAAVQLTVGPTAHVFPVGTRCQVQEQLDNGRYTVSAYVPDEGYLAVNVHEDQLEELSRTERQESLPSQTAVQGLVERIALRPGVVSIGLVTLKGRHETFIVHAKDFDEEASLRLTQAGDKVRFVVDDTDENRPRGSRFQNLQLN